MLLFSQTQPELTCQKIVMNPTKFLILRRVFSILKWKCKQMYFLQLLTYFLGTLFNICRCNIKHSWEPLLFIFRGESGKMSHILAWKSCYWIEHTPFKFEHKSLKTTSYLQDISKRLKNAQYIKRTPLICSFCNQYIHLVSL